MTSFWQGRKLAELSADEWESLCDGCAQCCAHKLEDEDSGAVAITDIACRLLDVKECRCASYSKRNEEVPACLPLNPERVTQFSWLPDTCGYRRVAEDRPLPYWHHLLTGDKELVHTLGVSVKNQLVKEESIEESDWQEHVIRWV